MVSPDGRHVYATAGADDALAVFTRDPDTGQLTQTGCALNDAPETSSCTKASALDDASEVQVSPDGRHVYVTAIASQAVTAFERDGSSGAVREVQCLSEFGDDCTTGERLSFATSVEVTSDGARVYVTDAGGSALTAYRRDSATGRLEAESCVEERDPEADDEDEDEGDEGLDCAPARGIFGAKGLALSPDDQSAYVAADTRATRWPRSARRWRSGPVGARDPRRHADGDGGLPAGRPRGCAGTAALDRRGMRSAGAGRGSFRVSAGGARAVRVRLSRPGRRLLRRRGRIAVRMAVREHGSLALPAARGARPRPLTTRSYSIRPPA